MEREAGASQGATKNEETTWDEPTNTAPTAWGAKPRNTAEPRNHSKARTSSDQSITAASPHKCTLDGKHLSLTYRKFDEKLGNSL